MANWSRGDPADTRSRRRTVGHSDGRMRIPVGLAGPVEVALAGRSSRFPVPARCPVVAGTSRRSAATFTDLVYPGGCAETELGPARVRRA